MTFSTHRQCDRAISCVHAIESATLGTSSEQFQNLLPTILYAKFAILLKDEDHEEAESTLRSLIKHPATPFQTSLTAVKSFVDDTWKVGRTSGGNSKLEFYKLLSYKFPR